MSQFGAVAVGTVPAGITQFRAASERANDTIARLEVVTASSLDKNPPPFVVEWKRLCSGNCHVTDMQSAEKVEKVQLAGPITLLAGGYAPLQETFRGTRAAIDTLLDHFPNATEVWLDEPLLDRSRATQLPLLEKCLRALRGEFFDLTFGVHLCNEPPWRELGALDVIDVLHFDAWRFGDGFLSEFAYEGSRPLEIVAGIVLTTGELPSVDQLADRVEQLLNQLPTGLTLRRLSTSCGLAGLKPDDAARRLERLDQLVDALNG